MAWAVLILHAFWLAIGLMLFNAATTCASPSCGGGGAGNWAIMSLWALVEMFLLPASMIFTLLAVARRVRL